MKHKAETHRPKANRPPLPKSQRSPAATAAEVGVGAAAGAAVGAIAGPPGAVAGAILGGAAGAVAAMAMGNADRDSAIHEEKLDEEIGVASGSLGAPNLKHPPAKIGAYSAGAAGAPSSGGTPAEGPMQGVDEG